MLKILLKLWWIQKRRTFDWKRLGLFIYMMLCVLVGLGAGYWQAGGELDQLTSRGEMGLIIVQTHSKGHMESLPARDESC